MALIRSLLNYGTVRPKVMPGQKCPCDKLRQKLNSFFHCYLTGLSNILHDRCTSRSGMYMNDA